MPFFRDVLRLFAATARLQRIQLWQNATDDLMTGDIINLASRCSTSQITETPNTFAVLDEREYRPIFTHPEFNINALMLNMPTYGGLVGGQTLEHYCAGVLLALPWVFRFFALDI